MIPLALYRKKKWLNAVFGLEKKKWLKVLTTLTSDRKKKEIAESSVIDDRWNKPTKIQYFILISPFPIRSTPRLIETKVFALRYQSLK